MRGGREADSTATPPSLPGSEVRRLCDLLERISSSRDPMAALEALAEVQARLHVTRHRLLHALEGRDSADT
jgi:hypothetical protein